MKNRTWVYFDSGHVTVHLHMSSYFNETRTYVMVDYDGFK